MVWIDLDHVSRRWERSVGIEVSALRVHYVYDWFVILRILLWYQYVFMKWFMQINNRGLFSLFSFSNECFQSIFYEKKSIQRSNVFLQILFIWPLFNQSTISIFVGWIWIDLSSIHIIFDQLLINRYACVFLHWIYFLFQRWLWSCFSFERNTGRRWFLDMDSKFSTVPVWGRGFEGKRADSSFFDRQRKLQNFIFIDNYLFLMWFNIIKSSIRYWSLIKMFNGFVFQ